MILLGGKVMPAGGKIRTYVFLPIELIQRIAKLKEGFSKAYRMKISTSQVMIWIIENGLPLVEQKLKEEERKIQEET